jgi:hypothetical protein
MPPLTSIDGEFLKKMQVVLCETGEMGLSAFVLVNGLEHAADRGSH